MQADRNFAECQLTEVEGDVNDLVTNLVRQGVSLAEAVERIEQENNFADVAEALADPVFRAWLLGEPHPAAERDRLADLLKQSSAPVRDEAGKVTYYPWQDGWAVGFRARHDDGRQEYVYLNPSTTDGADDDWPNVFVYTGPDGDPATGNDKPWHHYDVFRADAGRPATAARLADLEDPSTVRRGVGEDWTDEQILGRLEQGTRVGQRDEHEGVAARIAVEQGWTHTTFAMLAGRFLDEHVDSATRQRWVDFLRDTQRTENES